MTDVATEMPRCRSISMKSDVAPRLILFDLTAPATWIAPPKSSSFSVRVVLPASGWLMMAKVRLRSISCFSSIVFLCRLPVYGVCRAAILPLRSGRRSDRVSPDSSCSLSLGGKRSPFCFAGLIVALDRPEEILPQSARRRTAVPRRDCQTAASFRLDGFVMPYRHSAVSVSRAWPAMIQRSPPSTCSR